MNNGLCGNQERYGYIKEWINKQIDITNSRLSFENFLFVCGNSGIGKTHSILKICEELNLFVSYLTTNNCSSSVELKDCIVKNTSSSLIQILTNDTKKKIIIIDEFDSMISLDRTINTTMFNILAEKKYKLVPIICISSLDVVKKIGNIKKKCEIIELGHPTNEDIYCLLKNLNKNISEEMLKNVINKSNNNLYQCMNNISIENSRFLYDKTDDIINVNELYGKTYNQEYIVKLLLNDPWLYPLRYHENLINELQNRELTTKRQHEFYKHFMNNIVFFDLLMYNNLIQDACHVFTLMTYNLYKINHKKNKSSDLSNFTKILSYLSLQKKNIKKNYTSVFPIYQLDSYHVNMAGINYIFFN